MAVDTDLVTRYNYDEFVPAKFHPWMNFDKSPAIGDPAPSFPLWRLDDQAETSLSDIWAQHRYTAVEFGSFT